MEPVAVELPSEALALIEAGEHFDVAALDLVMPEMDGFELAREIRRHRERAASSRSCSSPRSPSSRGRARPRSSPSSSRSRSRPRSSTTRCVSVLAEQRAGAARRRAPPPARRQPETVVVADPAGGGQRREPEGCAPAPRQARLPRRRGVERPRGARGARAAALRRRADGRADAGDGRARRLAPDLRALAGRDPGPASSP